MTIAAAWIRQTKTVQELFIASDSRLSGGMRWDQCPKILVLPRSDCAICFAGDTGYTYPLMLQLANAIDAFEKSRTRADDIRKLRGHVVKTFNALYDAIKGQAPGEDAAGTEFLLAGYSWVSKEFKIWKIAYNKTEKKFVHITPRALLGTQLRVVEFAGDWAPIARNRLRTLMKTRLGPPPLKRWRGLDMEPLEVIRDLLRSSGPDDTIGGAPQVVKIFQHLNARPYIIPWIHEGKTIHTLFGRHLLPYETTRLGILDVDTMQTSRHGLKNPTTQERHIFSYSF
ncbi:hypothetical protein [Corallococcus exercitus]|uniref:Uncharacterized protein n=1 Tax=Corallococcus exercitus TaxID=2316736 RepID=A0A7Y4KL90_9BACT|nr:hypothetical protein [Corallococcus exercitus]NOK35024.1 hypothetical protein [Corallococcus exercitus]